MKRAIGERRREAEERVDGEGFEFGLERKCGSQFLMLKGLVVGLGWEGLGFRVCRLEKRPPRTVGRFWEGLRWP